MKRKVTLQKCGDSRQLYNGKKLVDIAQCCCLERRLLELWAQLDGRAVEIHQSANDSSFQRLMKTYERLCGRIDTAERVWLEYRDELPDCGVGCGSLENWRDFPSGQALLLFSKPMEELTETEKTTLREMEVA